MLSNKFEHKDSEKTKEAYVDRRKTIILFSIIYVCRKKLIFGIIGKPNMRFGFFWS
jgi:hypothetical protein